MGTDSGQFLFMRFSHRAGGTAENGPPGLPGLRAGALRRAKRTTAKQDEPGRATFHVRRVNPPAARRRARFVMLFVAVWWLTMCGFRTAERASVWGAESAPPAAAPGSLEERRAVGKLLAEFNAARRDLQRRAEIVAEARQKGEAYVQAIDKALRRELYPQLERYRQMFYSQASALASKRMARIDLEEVARLRQTVLGLRERPDFSKELIIRQGDPALDRLREIFVISRDEVLAASEKLRSERERLARLGSLWDQCAEYLYQQLPDDENKPSEPPSFEKYLQSEESLAAGLAAPMDPRTRQILAANARLAARLDAEEARAILATNLTRNLLGLPALMIDLRLCAAARDHSQDMERLKFFSHDSPVPGKATPWDRAKRFGTTASAENIAAGYRDGAAAVTGWFHSPGHHKNMLGNHKRIGVGRSGRYYTQMFGK